MGGGVKQVCPTRDGDYG